MGCGCQSGSPLQQMTSVTGCWWLDSDSEGRLVVCVTFIQTSSRSLIGQQLMQPHSKTLSKNCVHPSKSDAPSFEHIHRKLSISTALMTTMTVEEYKYSAIVPSSGSVFHHHYHHSIHLSRATPAFSQTRLNSLSHNKPNQKVQTNSHDLHLR